MKIKPAQRLSHIKEYYFSTKLREIRYMDSQGMDIINLGIGSPDLPPSDEAINQLIHHAKDLGNHAYQPYKGIEELREAFRDWYLNTFEVQLNYQEEILPLMGSKEGIMHITMAFVNPGDEILVPNPGYPTYASVGQIVGGNVRSYPLTEHNNWEPDLDQLAQQDLSKVKIMWINYPHMPTGTKANDELFHRLVEFAHEHHILLCHDNPYSLVLNPEPKSILSVQGAKEVAIELNSLSKSHNMAGWRIGMVAGAKEYLTHILKVKSNMDSGMFKPLQQAASWALRLESQWHEERNSVYLRRRDRAFEILKVLGCKYREDQVGMFIWAKLPEGNSTSKEFSDTILHGAKVFLTPGFIFGDQGEGYIRISLCNPIERLNEALDRINTFSVTPKATIGEPGNH